MFSARNTQIDPTTGEVWHSGRRWHYTYRRDQRVVLSGLVAHAGAVLSYRDVVRLYRPDADRLHPEEARRLAQAMVHRIRHNLPDRSLIETVGEVGYRLVTD